VDVSCKHVYIVYVFPSLPVDWLIYWLLNV